MGTLTLNFRAPDGTVEGDMLVAVVAGHVHNMNVLAPFGNMVTPAGWNTAVDWPQVREGRARVLWRRATADDVAGTTYPFTVNAVNADHVDNVTAQTVVLAYPPESFGENFGTAVTDVATSEYSTPGTTLTVGAPPADWVLAVAVGWRPFGNSDDQSIVWSTGMGAVEYYSGWGSARFPVVRVGVAGEATVGADYGFALTAHCLAAVGVS